MATAGADPPGCSLHQWSTLLGGGRQQHVQLKEDWRENCLAPETAQHAQVHLSTLIILISFFLSFVHMYVHLTKVFDIHLVSAQIPFSDGLQFKPAKVFTFRFPSVVICIIQLLVETVGIEWTLLDCTLDVSSYSSLQSVSRGSENMLFYMPFHSIIMSGLYIWVIHVGPSVVAAFLRADWIVGYI